MRRFPLLLLLASAVYVTVWIWVAAPTDARLVIHMNMTHCVVSRPEPWCPAAPTCTGRGSASVAISPRDIIDWAVAKGSIGQVDVYIQRYVLMPHGCVESYMTYVLICMPKPVWANITIYATQVWLNGTMRPIAIRLTQPDYIDRWPAVFNATWGFTGGGGGPYCFKYWLQPTLDSPLGEGDYIYEVPYTFDNITIVVEGRWFPVKTPS
jgi:hypothetical protein